MYTLAFLRDFTAQHALIGGDWGAENQTHPHDYLLEVQLEGAELNQHGFLVDLVEVEAAVDRCLDGFAGQTLNDLPAFAGLNPSTEHFARILAETLAADLPTEALSGLTVRIWENRQAWASYRMEL